MRVSRTLKKLAAYVDESQGDERSYALCVFTDVAVREGTPEAARYCSQVLAYHITDKAEIDEADDDLREKMSKETAARKMTVEFLVESVSKLDRTVDRELVRQIAARALRQMGVEDDAGIRAKLTRLLQSLGVSLEKIPSTHLAIFAGVTLATRLAIAA